MGTRALAVLLLAPSLALAQTAGQATLTVNDRTTFDTTQVNRAECASTAAWLDVRYLATMASGATYLGGSDKYRFFASTSACSSTLPSTSPIAADQAAVLGSAPSAQLQNASGDALRGALTQSCAQANDSTYYVCVYLTDSTGTTVKGTASSGALTFQMAVPPAPAITGLLLGNGALEVTVAKGTTTTSATADAGISFQAVASASLTFGTATNGTQGSTTCTIIAPCTCTAANPCAVTVTAPDPPNSSTTIRLEGLANTATYQVVAYAFSSAGNQSGASSAVSGTPLPFDDFWTAYRNAGGREQGGCGGGAGSLSLLALLPLALRRRP